MQLQNPLFYSFDCRYFIVDIVRLANGLAVTAEWISYFDFWYLLNFILYIIVCILMFVSVIVVSLLIVRMAWYLIRCIPSIGTRQLADMWKVEETYAVAPAPPQMIMVAPGQQQMMFVPPVQPQMMYQQQQRPPPQMMYTQQQQQMYPMQQQKPQMMFSPGPPPQQQQMFAAQQSPPQPQQQGGAVDAGLNESVQPK